MKTVRKFLFDTDFDAAGDGAAPRAALAAKKVKAEAAPVVEAPPPPPPEPTFTAAELAEARKEGQAKGLKDGMAKGKAEAQAQIEAQIGSALASIGTQVAALQSDVAQDRAAILGEGASLALAMTRKMLPEFTRRGGLAEVEAVIERCLVDLRREPRLTVRVPADLLPAMQEKIEALAAAKHFEGRINLAADDTLKDASCQVEWADGGLERHSDAIWRQVMAAFERCLTLQDISLAPAPDQAVVDDSNNTGAGRPIEE